MLALLTMQLSPDDVLLVARMDLADGLDSDAVEETSGRISAGSGSPAFRVNRLV